MPDELGPTPAKREKGKKPTSDGSGSAYSVSDGEESTGDSSDAVVKDLMMLGDDDPTEDFQGQQQRGAPVDQHTIPNYKPAPVPAPAPVPKPRPLKSPAPGYPECALCGERHGDGLGACEMTDSSQHLADYREILILHAEDEDWQTRVGGSSCGNVNSLAHKKSRVKLFKQLMKHSIAVVIYRS